MTTWTPRGAGAAAGPARQEGVCPVCDRSYSEGDQIVDVKPTPARRERTFWLAHASCVPALDDRTSDVTATKPVTSPATKQEAAETAGKIRRVMGDYGIGMELIRQAMERRHWVVLGYPSWGDYVVGEFGPARVKLKPEEREHFARILHHAGMSTRAIAPVLDVSRETVRGDLTKNLSPEQPDKITGMDGKSYPTTKPKAVKAAKFTQVVSEPVPVDDASVKPKVPNLRSKLAQLSPDEIVEQLGAGRSFEDLLQVAKLILQWIAPQDIDSEVGVELRRVAEFIVGTLR